MDCKKGKCSLRVAIIDDGINNELLQYLFFTNKKVRCLQVCNGICITQFLLPTKPENHGTLCTALLMEYLQKNGTLDNIDITSISILNSQQEQCLDAFIIALEWCAEKRLDIVLMSIGIKFPTYARRLLPAIQQLKNNMVTMIAATANDSTITYPACFKNVIGVKKSKGFLGLLDEINVIKEPVDGIEVTAAFSNSLVMEKYNKKYLDVYGNSNSFMVPFVASFICDLLTKKGRMTKAEILASLPQERTDMEILPGLESISAKDIPMVAVLYDEVGDWDFKAILEATIRKFEIEGYSCMCLTDTSSKSMLERSIFHLPRHRVNEWVGYYCHLLSNNSVIMILVDMYCGNLDLERMDATFMFREITDLEAEAEGIADTLVDWTLKELA